MVLYALKQFDSPSETVVFVTGRSSGIVEPVPASCVTVIVCKGTPIAETVTVAVRMAAVGFSSAVKTSVLLFIPAEGFTVSHD